ncbi:hypothetical protein THAOC_14500, partial [Thalassiosira oceanica]
SIQSRSSAGGPYLSRTPLQLNCELKAGCRPPDVRAPQPTPEEQPVLFSLHSIVLVHRRPRFPIDALSTADGPSRCTASSLPASQRRRTGDDRGAFWMMKEDAQCAVRTMQSQLFGDRLLYYDTKPKQDSKAREIGRAEETEMMGSGVEDRRTIELDVKRPADHDGATPDARNRTTTELWTISSSTNYIAASSISAVAVKSALAKLFSAAISLAPNGTAELEILPICNTNPQISLSTHAMLKARLEASEEERSQMTERQKSYSDAVQWAYTARSTPREHWLQRGYSEEYADAMVKLQRRIIHIIKDLMTGKVGDEVVVIFDLFDEDDGNHTDKLRDDWSWL